MLAGLVALWTLAVPTLQTLNLESRVLQGNPLGDPTQRKVAVFLPAQYTKEAKLKVVLYLPGFGGSSEDAIRDSKAWLDLTQRVADQVEPMVIAVADGRNRFGCSQYINSPASGRYMDYLVGEVLPAVERTFGCGGSASKRFVAGHSSGGFGALRIGMAKQRVFGHIVALSPDSYFDVTHLPLAKDPSCAKVEPSQVKALQRPRLAPFDGFEGEAPYAIALCACYAGNHDGSFEWLYGRDGKFRESVYARWLQNDPLTLARRPGAFHPLQTVFLEGAAQDDFKANIGAKAIFDALKGRPLTTFAEPPGHHSDRVLERLQAGLAWSVNPKV